MLNGPAMYSDASDRGRETFMRVWPFGVLAERGSVLDLRWSITDIVAAIRPNARYHCLWLLWVLLGSVDGVTAR